MRPRTARAIEPNVSRRKLYAKKLKKLFQDFSSDILNNVFDFLLEREGLEPIFSKDNKLLANDSDNTAKSVKPLGTAKKLALDISLTNPKNEEQRRILDMLKKRIDESIKRNPVKFRADLNSFIADNMVKWLENLEGASEDVAKWYVKNCAYDVSRSQRMALISAGIDEQVFKDRWKIPTVAQYISPNARVKIEELTAENVDLIQHVGATDLARIKNVLLESFNGETDFSKVEETLRKTSGFDEARVQRVALDQSNKISQTIQRENCLSLGMDKGVWIHVPGQYTSRKTHIEFDGQEFDIDVGLYDTDVEYEVVPGELPYCRCIFRSVIPDELLK